MKLLLDEHIPPVIAERLRERGHDVVSLLERPGLPGSEDETLLLLARREERALVTSDRDFITLGSWAWVGDGHSGIVFVPARFRRARRPIGLLIEALDALPRAMPGDDALADRMVWLEAPDLRGYSSR